MTKVSDDIKLDYQDVLLVPGLSYIKSRNDVDLYKPGFLSIHRSIPIIAANMDGVGTFEMCKILSTHKAYTALIKHYCLDELINFYTRPESDFAIWSMGATDKDMNKLKEFMNRSGYYPTMICVDVANGYMNMLNQFIYELRQHAKHSVLIAGNVCTAEGTRSLLEAGANYVKVGIGPGSVCTTRAVTGVGYPQFSAVLECVDAVEDYKDSSLDMNHGIIADGGCQNPGDILKALGAGASFVMLGGMLAGHDEGLPPETPPEGHTDHPATTGKVKFYGMASRKAQEIHNGGVAEYRASEGKLVAVPYRGPVERTIQHILGGLRGGMALVGARDFHEFEYKAKFVRVNHQINTVFGNG